MKKIELYAGLFLILLLTMGVPCAQAQQRSLYNDLRAHKVGDVITVILTENISGSSSTNATTDSKTDGSAKSGIDSNFLPFSPEFGANAKVTYNSGESMSADQKQLLRGTLSVRIKDVKDNGSYLIAGNRSTEINGERYKMTLEGFVRPSDISPANQVLSYRIANANITYLKQNDIKTHMHKAGFGRKVLWGLLGIATAAAVFMVSK
jgi:flagellar L-ring protein precursor FlgH